MASFVSDIDPVARGEVIRRGFLDSLPDRLGRMAAAFEMPPAEGRALLLDLLHALVGSAGTFRLSHLADAGRKLEGLLGKTAAGQPLSDTALTTAFQWLERAVAHVLAADPSELPSLVMPAPRKGRDTLTGHALVYYLEDDVEQARQLVSQLEPYDFHLVPFQEPAAFMRAVRIAPPDALLVDVMCGSSLMAGPDTISALTEEGIHLPTIFLSARGDFKARLQAVRAGGSGYMTKPVDTVTLVERLDEQIGRSTTKPYRILIVDDETEAAEQYAEAIRTAGMEPLIVNEPEETVEAIRAFGPDILLLDVNMPGCGGLELAALLRQHEGLLSLPILFITASAPEEMRSPALHLGASDFLRKPFAMESLADEVLARVRRARKLHALMARDSLTAVLNHGAVQEQLVIEVARSTRDGKPLSFAMIDIDLFKRINDDHGHAVGDRVLKALARLLQQRLRRTDIIGRYGGEEFAIILPGTPAEAAVTLLDKLRQDFAGIRFKGNEALGVGFNVSFSAGVAELREGLDLPSLNLAADSALYFAKRSGRNRVHLNGSLTGSL